MLRASPLTIKRANEFIARFHRHHKPVVGHRFSIAAWEGEELVGVVVVGRPVARTVDAEKVAEVTRLCTDGSRNACSFLYGRAARAAKAMGFRRIQTYILDSEPGTSLGAAGWWLDGEVVGRGWSCASRPRNDDHPTCNKQRWVRDFGD